MSTDFEKFKAEAIANLPFGEERLHKTFVINKHTPYQINNEDEHIMLNMPMPGEPGFYQQTTSFNAFFHGMLPGYERKKKSLEVEGKRLSFMDHYTWSRNYDGTFTYFLQDWYHYWTYVQTTRKRKSNPEWLPNYKQVQGIWEFYTLIGYDYKTRKWSPR